MNLLALTLRLLLLRLQRYPWLSVPLLLLTALAGAAWIGNAVGSGATLVEAVAPLGVLDRWVGVYWYAAAVTAPLLERDGIFPSGGSGPTGVLDTGCLHLDAPTDSVSHCKWRRPASAF